MICVQCRAETRPLPLANAEANGYRRVNQARRARRTARTLGLSGLEQAIRNALERAERSDPDIRARIYQSARNALDVGLRKQDIADPAVIGRQRQRLEATIREIEDEEMARLRSIAQFERVALEREPDEEGPAAAVEQERPPEDHRTEPVFGMSSQYAGRAESPVEPADEPAPDADEPLGAEFVEEPPSIGPAGRADARVAERSAGRVEPALEIEPETRTPAAPPRPEPRMDDGAFSDFSATRETGSKVPAVPSDLDRSGDLAEELAPAPGRGGRVGSFLVSVFVYLFLFGIIGGGVWWVYDTGMIDAALKGSSDFQLVPEALRSGSKQPAREEARLDTLRGFSGDWVDIYKPGASADAIVARAKATIDEHRDSDGLATIITSNAPDQDGDVLVAVPATILQELAGKTSTIAVTVKSNSDKPAQIYIQCEFKTLGDCGRHRYTVTNERADELIQIRFDGRMAPSSPGHIVINSDLTGEGSSIRLYGIRVLPGS